MPRTRLPGDAQLDVRLRIADPPKPERDPVIPHPERPEGALDPQLVGRVENVADFSARVPPPLTKFYAEVLGIDLRRVGGPLVVSATSELRQPLQLVVACKESHDDARDQREAERTWQELYDQLPPWEKARVAVQEALCDLGLWLRPPRLRRSDLARELPFLSRLATLLMDRVGTLTVEGSVLAPILPPSHFWDLDVKGRAACVRGIERKLFAISSMRTKEGPYGLWVNESLRPIPAEWYRHPTSCSIVTTLEEELLFILYQQYLPRDEHISLVLPPSKVLCAGTFERGSGRLAVLETRVVEHGGDPSFHLRFVSPADAMQDESLRIRRVSAP